MTGDVRVLKWMGVLIVITGSSGLAFRIVGERRAYLEKCLAWREVFSLIENEIAFQKSSFPEICSRAGMHISGNKRLFLERIGNALQKGEGGTLEEIWRRETEAVFAEEPLKKAVEGEIKALGGRLCFEDGGMQRKVLRDIEKYLKKHEEEQEDLNRERNRLTLCAGVMGGLLLTILFL